MPVSFVSHIGLLLENSSPLPAFALKSDLMALLESPKLFVVKVTAAQEVEVSFIALYNIEILRELFVEFTGARIFSLPLRQQIKLNYGWTSRIKQVNLVFKRQSPIPTGITPCELKIDPAYFSWSNKPFMALSFSLVISDLCQSEYSLAIFAVKLQTAFDGAQDYVFCIHLLRCFADNTSVYSLVHILSSFVEGG